MPQGDSTKIKSLVVTPNQSNQENPYEKEIFVVTMDYVQRLKLDSRKIGKEAKNSNNFGKSEETDRKSINLIKDWYHYSQ